MRDWDTIKQLSPAFHQPSGQTDDAEVRAAKPIIGNRRHLIVAKEQRLQ